MKLNNKKCETASREKDGAKLFDGGGLFLELHKNGSKYWRYKYRAFGKEKVLALGVQAYRYSVFDFSIPNDPMYLAVTGKNADMPRKLNINKV